MGKALQTRMQYVRGYMAKYVRICAHIAQICTLNLGEGSCKPTLNMVLTLMPGFACKLIVWSHRNEINAKKEAEMC